MSILGNIINAIADYFRPEGKSIEAAAAANPAFANWRHSIVDLLKLAHPSDPDGASSMESRKKLAEELGKPNYTGTAEENEWLHKEVMKELRRKGVPL